MDGILKSHFDNYMEKGELPPELSKLCGEVTLFNNAEQLKIWRSNFKGIRWTDSNGNMLKGAIDNLLQKEDKLIVLDYKTRGFPLKEDTHEHSQDQLDIYNFLLRKNGYETEDYAYLLFYHPKRVEENGYVEFNTDLIKIKIDIGNAEKIFKKALEALDGVMPKPSAECGYCKWVDDCNSEIR